MCLFLGLILKHHKIKTVTVELGRFIFLYMKDGVCFIFGFMRKFLSMQSWLT